MNYHFSTKGVESPAQLPVISVVLRTAIKDYLDHHEIDFNTYADNLDVDRYQLNGYMNNLSSLENFTLKDLDRLMTFHGFDVSVNVTER